MEMHNSFEKQDSIHRDTICSRTLFGHIPNLQTTVPFGGKDIVVDFRRRVGAATLSNSRVQKP
jgi:hypothetical protein